MAIPYDPPFIMDPEIHYQYSKLALENQTAEVLLRLYHDALWPAQIEVAHLTGRLRHATERVARLEARLRSAVKKYGRPVKAGK